MKTSLLLSKSGGFSLVEVTLALGIVSFALLAVVGLLPTGLKSIKSANEQAGAANALNSLADSLRKAQSTNASSFGFTFGNQTITYDLGGGALSNSWTNLNLDGNVAAANESPRLSARLQVFQTPGTDNTPGRAVVSVAWSAISNPGWDAGAQRWTNADGSLTTGVQFLPRK